MHIVRVYLTLMNNRILHYQHYNKRLLYKLYHINKFEVILFTDITLIMSYFFAIYASILV